jgi:Mrp family chromosome partitioning ATPase
MTPMRTSGDLVGYTPVEPVAPVEMRPSLRLSRFLVMVVVVSAVITAIVAAAFVALQAPVYNTTRSVIVLSGSNPNDNDVLSRALESLASSKGMAAEIKRRGNLDLTIDQIAGMISTRRSPESPYMDVVVSSTDRELSEAVSAQVIPAMRGVFDRNQQELPVEQRIPGPIFQEVFAKPLQSTSTFPVWFAAVFGALLGGLVPYLIFLYRNLRKPVVTSAQDVTDAIDLPILVKVPALTGRGGNPQDAVAGVISAVERLSLNEPIHRLVLVGADNGADRSALALALACVVARSFGQPVALVDADLERGTLTGLVHAEDVAGLSECLAGQLDPEKAMLTLTDAQLPPDLDGLAAPEGMVRFLGAGVDRSRNILRMRSTFHRVLEGMAGRYVVIINGPKVPGPVPTSQMLSLADATLMVVAEGQTSLTDARSAGDTLRSFSCGPAGVVVIRR